MDSPRVVGLLSLDLAGKEWVLVLTRADLTSDGSEAHPRLENR